MNYPTDSVRAGHSSQETEVETETSATTTGETTDDPTPPGLTTPADSVLSSINGEDNIVQPGKKAAQYVV